MLVRAEVSNFKSIAHADLTFGAENIIVGQNGVGKSNFIDALHFVRDAAQDGLDNAITKRHGIASIRRWSKTKPYNLTIKLTYKSIKENGYYKVCITSNDGDFHISEEEASWSAPNPFPNKDGNSRELVTSSFHRTSDGITKFEIPENPFGKTKFPSLSSSDLIVSEVGKSIFGPISFMFRGLFQEIDSFGAYSIYPNKIREPQSISMSEMLYDDGSNLASIIRQMRTTSQRANKEALTAAIKEVMPIVSEIRVESAGGFYVPVFRVRESESGYSHDLNMSQISDGTLRMLGMLTAFYQPKAPMRIALEEPEQMIHPGLLPVLLESARDYLDKRPNDRQIFFTTHSPTFLDLFDAKGIIGCKFENGISKLSKISERQLSIIKERLFSAGELLVAEGICE